MPNPDYSRAGAKRDAIEPTGGRRPVKFAHIEDGTFLRYRVGATEGDISDPVDGDIWYNASTGKHRKKAGGAITDLDLGAHTHPISDIVALTAILDELGELWNTPGEPDHGSLAFYDQATAKWVLLPAPVATSTLQFDPEGAAEPEWGTGAPGGGDNVSVNGTAAADVDLDNATPAAPGDGVNVRWQKDAGTPNNVSANIPTGSSSSTVCVGNDSRLSDARTPTAHATSHQPGGGDAMTVDAVAGTGSLRTIGTGGQQACAGNDGRLSDSRTPTAHKASHQHGGSDEVAVVAAAANAIPKAGAGGTLATGWLPTVPVAKGGTGQITAQAATNALTQVSGATNEHILTKDTATGDALWKVNTPATETVSVRLYAPGAFTVGTGNYSVMSRHLILTGSQRVTLQGNATLRIA